MSGITSDLYRLLPQVVRVRDEEQGFPLRALFHALEKSAQVVERNIEQLYDNQFIETCEEWVVPYIGDLLGVRSLHPIEGERFSHRARVANTLAYRRRKGTITMLEQLARDCTAWGAAAVEMFHLAGWTQNLNHLAWRPTRTPDLHDTNALELLGGPFDRITTTIDVRGIDAGLRTVNIPNIGIFLWRLVAYPMVKSRARRIGAAGSGLFTFDSTGLDIPLFNNAEPEETITHVATERNVPGPLRRRPLYEELLPGGELDFFKTPAVLSVWIDDVALDPSRLAICDLTDWNRPTDASIGAAVDPVLGRIALGFDEDGNALTTDNVSGSYSFGFPGDIGGGPYSRRDENIDDPEWQVGVPVSNPNVPDHPTLTDAIDEWNLASQAESGRIVVTNNDIYAEKLSQIELRDTHRLTLLAADWPFPNLDMGDLSRENSEIVADGLRPTIVGDLSVLGVPTADGRGGSLSIDGFWIEGNVSVEAGGLAELNLRHCTLVPPAALTVLKNESLRVNLYRCVLGSITFDDSVEEIKLTDCIVLGDINAPGSRANITGCTIFGQTNVRELDADSTIFDQTVTVRRVQVGCVRFCYLPEGSRCPRRYRCQPDLALEGVAEGSGQEDRIRASLVPMFVSRTWGNPALAQLRRTTAIEIREGTEDGSEMGAWSFLKNPQREANLRASLDEYLRYGLEAGLLFVT